MLNEKDLIMLRNERRADYLAEEARFSAKREGIANANAELNNLGLPNVFEMASVMKGLVAQAKLAGLPLDNYMLQRAEKIVAAYDDGSAGANL